MAAAGAGSERRVSLGVAVVGGMLCGTFLTLFVIPAIYSFLSAETQTPLGGARPRQQREIREPQPSGAVA